MAESNNISVRNVLCNKFAKGICENGESCRFSHDRENSLPETTCWHFLNGNCFFGDHCRYAHVRPEHIKRVKNRSINNPNNVQDSLNSQSGSQSTVNISLDHTDPAINSEELESSDGETNYESTSPGHYAQVGFYRTVTRVRTRELYEQGLVYSHNAPPRVAFRKSKFVYVQNHLALYLDPNVDLSDEYNVMNREDEFVPGMYVRRETVVSHFKL